MSAGEPIAITVRLFAMLRESAGSGSLELELPPGATVAEALRRLAGEGRLGELLDRLPVATAVNREYAREETVLAAGDELALIPPVSGGAEQGGGAACAHALVTGEPLSAERVRRAVSDPRAGAIVIFEGVTREVEALDYEAYAEMAQMQIGEILGRCILRHGLTAAAGEHRTGRVALGEPSVIVAVSAPHREEAFAGAREAIDEIKARAPIWKREHGGGADGAWVEGQLARTGVEVEQLRDEGAEAGLRTGGA